MYKKTPHISLPVFNSISWMLLTFRLLSVLVF